MFIDVWDRVVVPILITIFTGVIGWIGIQLKNMIERKNDEKREQEREFEQEREKVEIAENCVRWTEQVHSALHGAEKFAKCLDSFVSMLAMKGITITDLEAEMLIESTVQRLNSEDSLALPKENTESLLQECKDCDITYAEGVSD